MVCKLFWCVLNGILVSETVVIKALGCVWG